MYIAYLLLGHRLVLLESAACSPPLSSFSFPKVVSSA